MTRADRVWVVVERLVCGVALFWVAVLLALLTSGSRVPVWFLVVGVFFAVLIAPWDHWFGAENRSKR